MSLPDLHPHSSAPGLAEGRAVRSADDSPAGILAAAPRAVGRAARIAIVGAESTGKSMLANALRDRLDEEFGLRSACIGEYLREWCDDRRRTPHMSEQWDIAHEQERRIDEAAARVDVDVVICDTTPMMTAIYSALLFDDRTIDEFAAACQRRADITLLTALDLPWVADGLQRDGPHVRQPVDTLIRARLREWGVAFSLISGIGPARASHALDALRPLVRGLALRTTSGSNSGLFSRLVAGGTGPPAPAWVCERCDEPDCEHRAGPRLTA